MLYSRFLCLLNIPHLLPGWSSEEEGREEGKAGREKGVSHSLSIFGTDRRQGLGRTERQGQDWGRTWKLSCMHAFWHFPFFASFSIYMCLASIPPISCLCLHSVCLLLFLAPLLVALILYNKPPSNNMCLVSLCLYLCMLSFHALCSVWHFLHFLPASLFCAVYVPL